MQLIPKYFPDLDPIQTRQMETLLKILPVLNQQVNVVSRKDIGFLEERHILHSLSIAKRFTFGTSCRVIDVGTGGGFPGIPLAILYPEAQFTLVDSIGKKVRMVKEVVSTLGLKNSEALHQRMEMLDQQADYIVSRAVTAFPQLVKWTNRLLLPGPSETSSSGLIALKGGDLRDELKPFHRRVEVIPISTWFEEPFFSTKMIVYLKK